MSTPLRTTPGPDVHAIARHFGYLFGIIVVSTGLVLYLVSSGARGELMGIGAMGTGAFFILGTFIVQFL